jgi:hypothetical protein
VIEPASLRQLIVKRLVDMCDKYGVWLGVHQLLKNCQRSLGSDFWTDFESFVSF